eukprot:m.44209 g.44209  ORF g.44209 m.44209 type:complete len:515 (-) comp10068_c0_seq2:13-1557(-)
MIIRRTTLFILWACFCSRGTCRPKMIQREPSPKFPKNKILKQIVSWNTSVDPGVVSLAIIHEGNPTILKDTPCDDWPAAEWTLESLQDDFGDLMIKNVKETMPPHPRVIPYEITDQLLFQRGLPEGGTAKTKVVPYMKLRQLLASVRKSKWEDDKKKPRLYYSDELQGDMNLQTSPHQWMIAPTCIPRKHRQYHSKKVWIAGKGVIAASHYDLTHNFYYQIAGKKRFTIVSPEWFRTMCIYPASHILPRHSQVNMTHPDMKLCPQFAQAQSITLQLNPGEMLYLPPNWFHHVETLTSSISINVWSPSLSREVLAYLRQRTKREDIQFKTPTEATFFILHYVKNTIPGVFNFGEALEWLRDAVYEPTYKPLYLSTYGSKHVCAGNATATACKRGLGINSTHRLDMDTMTSLEEKALNLIYDTRSFFPEHEICGPVEEALCPGGPPCKKKMPLFNKPPSDKRMWRFEMEMTVATIVQEWMLASLKGKEEKVCLGFLCLVTYGYELGIGMDKCEYNW